MNGKLQSRRQIKTYEELKEIMKDDFSILKKSHKEIYRMPGLNSLVGDGDHHINDDIYVFDYDDNSYRICINGKFLGRLSKK